MNQKKYYGIKVDEQAIILLNKCKAVILKQNPKIKPTNNTIIKIILNQWRSRWKK